MVTASIESRHWLRYYHDLLGRLHGFRHRYRGTCAPGRRTCIIDDCVSICRVFLLLSWWMQFIRCWCRVVGNNDLVIIARDALRFLFLLKLMIFATFANSSVKHFIHSLQSSSFVLGSRPLELLLMILPQMMCRFFIKRKVICISRLNTNVFVFDPN